MLALTSITALRLYTAAPSLLERVVPSASDKPNRRDEDFDLLGYALPAGTVVCTQAWSMHRNPDVFPSPESFLPERWLKSTTPADHLQQMHQHLIAFGTGSRVCGGQNLAHLILRVVVSIVVRNFNLSAPEETNERSMEIKDSFVSYLSAAVLSRKLMSVIGHLPRSNGLQPHLHTTTSVNTSLFLPYIFVDSDLGSVGEL